MEGVKRQGQRQHLTVGQMREVELRLTKTNLADAMGELRKWLDHHNCVPVNFDIERGKRRVLVVRILFFDDAMADVFERDFGGR